MRELWHLAFGTTEDKLYAAALILVGCSWLILLWWILFGG
jgi:hypothetical protein